MENVEKVITAKKKAGRKKKFQETTRVFAVRLPISRFDEIKMLILDMINRKPDGE